MKITFWGAAQTTTGSFHLIETKGRRVVLDCGLFQGRRALAREINETFPVAPSDVDAVIMSHAHIDHAGNLPTFVRHGFKGDVYATPATDELLRVMLQDSAHIQEKDAHFLNKRRGGGQRIEPLYTSRDTDNVFPLIESLRYYREREILPGIRLKFLDAGHILGSAIVQLDIEENGTDRRVVFSGDIGRRGHPILREWETPGDTDYLIMESTYGNRVREPEADVRQHLKDLVARVSARGGKIIVPAFSVGRTQEIVYHLNALFNSGELAPIPCYVDSPLSLDVTEVFRRHTECFNRATVDLMHTDEDPFGFRLLTYLRDVRESKELNNTRFPCVIIAASGMCEAGRILHHLRNSVEDPKNCVLIVGYQAEHTLGRRIVERSQTVRIFGQEHRLRAEVDVINALSAHADQDELKDFAFKVRERGNRLRRVFLVHGEEKQQAPLAGYLREHLELDVAGPARGESVTVD